MEKTKLRFHVVDALRGFAIVAILLLHNIEHFDFAYHAENIPSWMVGIDKSINDTMFFLFGGKAYAIFAFLFGLTFFIQDNNQLNKGMDFRGRFVWRMVLLFGFGIINSVFYQGDILLIYSVIGLFLLPVARLNTKIVLIIAAILMLQPLEWVKLIQGLQNPHLELDNPKSWAYFGQTHEYLPGSSILDTWAGNLSTGKKAVLIWWWEKGRDIQTLALFMLGMIMGRLNIFSQSEKNKKLWTRILLSSIIGFAILFTASKILSTKIEFIAIKRPLLTIIDTNVNFCFMLVQVSLFILIFWTARGYKLLNVFSSMGKMSLSNYIFQSIIGAIIYHGYGLGLYKYTGASYSLLIGLLITILLSWFSKMWLKANKRGPLETLWHKLTWLKAGEEKKR